MKFVTFGTPKAPRLGALDAKRGILDLKKADAKLPGDMLALIEGGVPALKAAKKAFDAALKSKKAGLWTPLKSAKLLAPIPAPRKNVFCVGRNYRLHIIEGARARGHEPVFPKVPEFFSKPRTTVVGHDAPVNATPRTPRSSITRSNSASSSASACAT